VLAERFENSARVKAWRSADEFDHPLKLKRAKLRHNLFDAALVEQQDSRDHVFGHALSGGPAHPIGRKIETEAIRHDQEHNPPAERMHQQAWLEAAPYQAEGLGSCRAIRPTIAVSISARADNMRS
jgi:hypothetical protein